MQTLSIILIILGFLKLGIALYIAKMGVSVKIHKLLANGFDSISEICIIAISIILSMYVLIKDL